MFRWKGKSSLQTVKTFIDAMNSRDFAVVEDLLADDFRLIDNTERELSGKAPCFALLKRVAELAPDYQLHVESLVRHGADILVSGWSESTSRELASATQWRARATREKMKEWQSYSNALTPSMIMIVHGGRE